MTDIFDEVGEDLRRERLKRFWQRYSWAVIGLAVLIVAATAGWRLWEHVAASRAAEAGAAYRAALDTADDGEDLAAAEALLAFSSGAPTEYGALARFRAATEHARAGETANAIAAFEALSRETALPPEMRDLAAIRAALVALDSEDLAAIRARVAAYDNDIASFRHTAREILAVAAIRAGAFEDARAMVDKLIADPAVPADIARRARILADVIRAAVGEPAAPAAAGS